MGARGPAVVTREPLAVRGAEDRRHHQGIDPPAGDELGVDGEPGNERHPRTLGRLAEALDLRPRRFRVHMVDGDRGDPAPVVDAGVEEAREVVVAQVRRALDMDALRQDQPRGGGGPQQLVERRLRMVGHLRPRLGAEVLDDHLLDVAVPVGQRGDRLQRLEPFLPRLADADQDAGRERDRQLAGEGDRLEPARGQLVRRAEVRHPPSGEPLGPGLQHQSHRDGDLAQRRQVLSRHHAGVEVRQEPGLLHDEPRAAREVLQRRLAAELGKLVARSPVAQLRLVAEREERLAAAGLRACPRDLEHLLLRHVRALAAPRRPGEGAVVADVPAELCQRDEDLRRVGDERPASEGPRLSAELVRRSFEECPRRHGLSLVPLQVVLPRFWVASTKPECALRRAKACQPW